MSRYDVAVVGMGSAGTVAVEFARSLGLRTCAIERDRLGGDCLWTGCVPSKALLASARVAHTVRTADAYGMAAHDPGVDPRAVMERVRAIRRALAETDDSPERFERMGVDVLIGAARLTRPGELHVEGHGTVRAKHVLLCTGSRPRVPEIPGLEDSGYLTSETMWEQERLPRSLTIIGGGYIALEQAQAHQRLGCPVTVLEARPTLLDREEPLLAQRLLARLRAEGVHLLTRVDIDRVERRGERVAVVAGEREWVSDALLVATGRTPNVEGLGLEALGIAVGDRGIEVDDGYGTSASSVHAAGDVAGRFQFTHSAGFEAARGLRNALFPGRQTRDFEVPWCTFTDPELAHVGLTEAEARAKHGDDVEVHVHELAHNDRARAEGHADGAIVVVCAKGRIVGGHVLAPGGGEVVHELALAVHQRLKLAELARVVHVYPTLSIGLQRLGGEAAYAAARKFRFLAR